MAEAPEPAEVYDTSECLLVPSSGETFEEARITSSTVFVTEDSGSRLIASQRKISYQTDTLSFYQQTSEFFLSYPPAERMGGLVGRFARVLGGNFREEPQDMLQTESVDAAGDTPSRSNSCSCRLSQETQRVSAHRHTYAYACSLQCCVNACVVSFRCCEKRYSVKICQQVMWLTIMLTWWDTMTRGHSCTRPPRHGGHPYNG